MTKNAKPKAVADIIACFACNLYEILKFLIKIIIKVTMNLLLIILGI